MRHVNDTSWGLLCSLGLHGLVILLGVCGLPFWSRLPSEPPRPIPIDVVTIDQLSQAPPPKPKLDKKQPPPPPEKPVEKPAEKPAPPERPEPLIQPKEKPPPPQEKPKEDKNPSEVPLPSKPKEEPKADKKPDKKTEKKPEKKPEKKKEEVKKETPKEAKKQKKSDFLSVLKNLETSAEEGIADLLESDLTSESSNAAEKISKDLTISELDLVKRQIMECWNVPAAAKDAKDLIIVLDLDMNRDGTVREASVVREKSSTNHPFYQAGVESALRAIRNPRCIPLKLPPDRYESWQSFEITFNPKDVQ